MRTCAVAGCNKTHAAKGYCMAHYNRWKTYGNPTHIPPPRIYPPTPTIPCAVEGCNNPRKARGWCPVHYKRWKRHGDPTAGTGPSPNDPTLPATPLTNRPRPPRLTDAHREALDDAERTGHLTIYMADKLSIEVFGLHPALIYGDTWWTTGLEDTA